MKHLTQKDIAKMVGVSRTAVSFTLNKRASLYRINPKTQKKILEVSKRMGYSKNLFASYLRTKKSNLIGILGAVYQVPIRQARQDLLAQYFKDRGFQVFIQDFHWSDDRIQLIKEMEELRPEGLIVTEPEPEEVIEYLRIIQKRGLPIVLVDGPKVKGFDQVRIDRKKGVYLGVKHLFEQNYERVFLTLQKDTFYWAISERFQGFKKAYKEFKKDAFPEKFLIWSEEKQYTNSYLLGYQIGKKFFSQERDLSAGIMALNDQVAIGLMKYMLENGVKIPQDIGLVGSENLPEGEFAYVSLTTIKFPIEELVEKVGEILLQKISGNKNEMMTFNIEPKLIVRQSSLKGK